MMITETDLRWWASLTSIVDWTWAKTYAKRAPHWWIALKSTPEMAREDFVRAARVINTFGRPEKFYGYTNIYLNVDSYKYWGMDPSSATTDLINRSEDHLVYGVQDAPSVESTLVMPERDGTMHDDDRHYGSRVATIGEALKRTTQGRSVTTLVLGALTGEALDARIVPDALTTAVEPSRSMANRLILKHPKLGEFIGGDPRRVARELAGEGKQYDVVINLDEDNPLPIAELKSLARETVLCNARQSIGDVVVPGVVSVDVSGER